MIAGRNCPRYPPDLGGSRAPCSHPVPPRVTGHSARPLASEGTMARLCRYRCS